jgi:hypothetical protein
VREDAEGYVKWLNFPVREHAGGCVRESPIPPMRYRAPNEGALRMSYPPRDRPLRLAAQAACPTPGAG